MSHIIPDRGDLVLINFTPQSGREQVGQRPAIVLSPKKFNASTGFASLCPITNQKKGWGFEVELPDGQVFSGVILTDHIKNLDWTSRGIEVKGQAPTEIVEDCLAKIGTFLT